MADVVVNQTPMAKLPYDPEVIPEAVKKRAAAVDALYGSTALASGTVTEQQTNGSGASGQTAPETPEPTPVHEEALAPPQVSAPAETVSPTSAPSAPAAPAHAPEDDSLEGWKTKFNRLNGAYTASQKTIGALQEQLMEVGNELLHATRAAQQPRPTPQPAPVAPLISEADVQNYGGELVDFAQRAAVHAVMPQLQELQQSNEELRKQLAREAKRALDQAVEIAVPDYREIDRNPRWHRWLLGIDLYSGRVRQHLLDDAIRAASAPRVISFFNGFKAEERATGHTAPEPGTQQASAPREPAVALATLAAPGRARPATGGDASLPSEKPTYTRPQIAQLYSAHRKGAYIGREAEWNRLELDIVAAGREGRVFER